MNKTDRHQHHCRSTTQNPSFSSSLLDQIYRSIDDQHLMLYTEKQKTNGCFHNDREVQQGLFDNWMDKQVCEKVSFRRRSAADFKTISKRNEHDSFYFNSSSSSSESSLGGFSSSDGESVYGGVKSRSKTIRTNTNRHDEYNAKENQRSTYDLKYQIEDIKSKPKYEGKFVKTKSKAMKIYGDLKKVKQPISPGGRLVTFLNSLFTTGNGKNTNLSSSAAGGSYDDGNIDRRSKSTNASTCSSASSFSRSCLSKNPSSRGKLSNNNKRSVRFFPVSVIVDEDCQPCGHKSLYGDESSNLQPQALKFIRNSITEEVESEKNRRIEEAARNLLRNYQKKVECEFDLIRNDAKTHNDIDMNFEDDDDDDDAASHTSSDLFELENFAAIGMEKYRDELPVYETTHLNTNLVIGNSFLM